MTAKEKARALLGKECFKIVEEMLKGKRIIVPIIYKKNPQGGQKPAQ